MNFKKIYFILFIVIGVVSVNLFIDRSLDHINNDSISVNNDFPKVSANDLPITNYTIHNEIDEGEIKEFNVSTLLSINVKTAFIIFKDIVFGKENNFSLYKKGLNNVYYRNITYNNLTIGYYDVYYGLIDDLGFSNSTVPFTIEFRGDSPYPFELTSTAKIPDTNGIFTLRWTDSKNVANYSIYKDNGFITEIDGTQTLITKGITKKSYDFEDYEDGKYFFMIVAYNETGNISSNCHEINIILDDNDLDDEIDDDDDDLLSWLWVVVVLCLIVGGIIGMYIARKLWNRYLTNRGYDPTEVRSWEEFKRIRKERKIRFR